MKHDSSRVSADARMLREAEASGWPARLKAYSRLAGPGWLQSAATLGGGTLAGSLYLGILAGPTLLWLQPLAMTLGVIMTGAIGYATLTIGSSPFHAIKRHLNPVLAWGWAVGAIAVCMVWAMPQYSLSHAVIQQILLPDLIGASSPFGEAGGKAAVTASIFLLVVAMTWNYGRAGFGVKLYEWLMKLTVMAIILCFIGVIVRLALLPRGLDWAGILQGFIPNPGSIFTPAPAFQPLLDAVPEAQRDFWIDHLVTRQRDVAVTVAAATVGINGTFLFAYSLLRHGWGREFRGFMGFDLVTGMLLPFVIVTACIVIAGSSQFHAVPQPGLLAAGAAAPAVAGASARQKAEFDGLLRGRVRHEAGEEDLDEAEIARRLSALGRGDRALAATLVTRDAIDLAAALRPLTGDFFARVVFSLGVLGMTISSITLQMVICGMVFAVVLDRPLTGWTFRLGSLAAGSGVLGPFLWSKAAFWLVVPTSIFAFMLLPIGYTTYVLMMNSRALLGDAMPAGGRRWAWNLVLGGIVCLTVPASLFVIWDKGRGWGLAAVGLFLAAVLATHQRKKRRLQPWQPVGHRLSE